MDEGNAPAIAALCRELDGSPLAIELAAARLAMLDPSELLARLRRTPDALGRGGRGVPGRQRGLRAAMQWSYGLLDAGSAALFRRLGHFAGEASLERIEEVCGDDGDDVFESLAGLVDFSLVRRTGDGRFALPSALRTFARELLDDSGEHDTLRRRHAHALIDELTPLAVEQPLTGRGKQDRIVHAEMADVTGLIEWSAARDLELCARLIALSFQPLIERGELPRWADLVDGAVAAGTLSGRMAALLRLAQRIGRESRPGWLQIAATADSEGHPLFAGWLLGTCAGIDVNAGLCAGDPGWPAARAALEQLRDAPQPELREHASDLEGYVLFGERRWDEALSAFEASVARGGGTWLARGAISFIGDCHVLAGRPAAALGAYANGVRAFLEAGQIGSAAFQSEGIAAALVDLDNPPRRSRRSAPPTCSPPSASGREISTTAWAEEINPRLDASRRALGADAAAAYQRGTRLSLSAAVERILELAASHAGSIRGAGVARQRLHVVGQPATAARRHSRRASAPSATAATQQTATTSHSTAPLPWSGSTPNSPSIQAGQAAVRTARAAATAASPDSSQKLLRTLFIRPPPPFGVCSSRLSDPVGRVKAAVPAFRRC